MKKISIFQNSVSNVELCVKLTSILKETSYIALCPTPTPFLAAPSQTLSRSRDLREAPPIVCIHKMMCICV